MRWFHGSVPQTLLLAGWLGLSCHRAPAQTAPAAPPTAAFDVASIAPSQTARRGGEGSGRERISWTPTGVTLENASLAASIQWAYQVKFYQTSGPAWANGQRYDIRAKNQNPANVERLRLMLRTLLADRFRLALHREAQVMPVYELLADRNRLKLQAAKADEGTDMRVANGKFVFQHVSMAELAERLSELAAVDRPVLDKTGIAGAFDFTLPAIPYPAPDGVDPAWIFGAIREQLGLVLKPAKGAVEMLVIDHAERPSPN
ncbi:MAG: TIGR03435 family protein [Bryobacteraceae bacterium]